MTITTGPTAPPAPPPGPAPAERRASARPGRLSRTVHALGRTPGRLRLALTVSILACLVIGVAGFQAGTSHGRALDDVRAGTARLVALQDVRTDLVAADASATNAFLVGGLEPAAMRAGYLDSVSEATSSLSSLAQDGLGSDDETALPFDALTRYTGEIEQARSNNRQGFPVGSAYLDSASTSLRTDVLDPLSEIGGQEQDDVLARFDDSGFSTSLLVWCLLGLLTLVAVQLWLARRTHRYLSAGLVVATALVLVGSVGAIVTITAAGEVACSVRDGAYARATAVGSAQVSAHDAKSRESVGLIRRGSGAEVEEFVQSSLTTARADFAPESGDPAVQGIADSLDAWSTAHDEIRALDDAGDWDGAVAAATSGEAGGSNATFETFNDQAQALIAEDSQEIDERLSHAATISRAAGWTLLALSLVAAVAAWRGIHRRLEEYR